MALDVRVNPRWSLKRMKEEHKKMTEELMKKDLEYVAKQMIIIIIYMQLRK